MADVVRVFEAVHLQVAVHVETPALMVCTALTRWSPTPPARTAPPARAQPRMRVSCKVRLHIQTRLAELYETARGETSVREGSKTVRVQLADGSSVELPAHFLARHSSMLRTLLKYTQPKCTAGSRVRGASGVTPVLEAGGGADAMAVAWREVWMNEICMRSHPPDVVRGVLKWMEAPHGPPKRMAAEALLVPDMIVEAARLSHFLDLQPLLHAALRIIGDSLDVNNAPSCLLLARELDSARLAEQARSFIVNELEGVEQNAEYWEQMPLHTREALKALRDATLRNLMIPSAGVARACAGCEPRELLGVVRESLAEQIDRLNAALEREAMAVRPADNDTEGSLPQTEAMEALPRARLEAASGRACSMPEDARQRRQVTEALATQALRIGALLQYLRQQEDVFAKLIDSNQPAQGDGGEEGAMPAGGVTGAPPKRKHDALSPCGPAALGFGKAGEGRELELELAADEAGNPVFVPLYEWQRIPDGVAFSPGLEIELPFDGRPRRARIPPRWRLRVWISREHGYWRTDVTRSTTVLVLRASAADHMNVRVENVVLRFASSHQPLSDADSCEQLDLFHRMRDLLVDARQS